MKILIIRFSSIGDIVLTSPVVRCLKKQMPGAEIHFLTRQNYKGIIDHNPYIDVLHYLSDDLNATIRMLKKENFDFIADLHNNFRTWRIKSALGIKSNSLNKLNFEKWIMVNFKWNILPVAHIVDRNINVVRHLGIENDGKGLDYFIGANEEVKIEDLPLTHLHGYIALAIGGQHTTKKLPLEKLKQLVDLLHYPLIVLGGPEDRDAGRALHELDPYKVMNGCHIFSINQSASIIRQAKLVITHDTGMMHIAAAYKKKIISIWGNTIPKFGMYPYFGNESIAKEKSTIVEVNNLSCRPCSKIGFNECPKKHFKCMNNLDLQLVKRIIEKY